MPNHRKPPGGIGENRRGRRWRGGPRSRALRDAGVADGPALKLVGEATERLTPRANFVQPIQGAADPRWVLAVRVSESLEGAILRPEKRARLLRVGRLLGLSPFDTNLVIAIIQDRARRGTLAGECPGAGAAQLEMVPLPRARGRGDGAAGKWRIAAIVGCLITVELFVLVKLLG